MSDTNIPDKSLKEKAINIKGKSYVQVSDRVTYFNEVYTNGAIQTELLTRPTDEMVVIKATVYPDASRPERGFTGYSQAKWGDGMVNKTSALENAETSAVGRALALMGIGVIESIASSDEIHKAQNTKPVQPTTEAIEDISLECVQCRNVISQKVHDYSLQKYGKALCYDCQQKQGGMK